MECLAGPSMKISPASRMGKLVFEWLLWENDSKIPDETISSSYSFELIQSLVQLNWQCNWTRSHAATQPTNIPWDYLGTGEFSNSSLSAHRFYLSLKPNKNAFKDSQRRSSTEILTYRGNRNLVVHSGPSCDLLNHWASGCLSTEVSRGGWMLQRCNARTAAEYSNCCPLIRTTAGQVKKSVS